MLAKAQVQHSKGFDRCAPRWRLPLEPVPESLISASLMVPWLVMVLRVLLWVSIALAVAYTGILVGGGV